MNPLRLVVADDHPVFRDGLVSILADDDAFMVVGEAANGVEAIALVDELRPDVVLMDVRMPELDGVGATQHIKATHPDIAVIVLTMNNDEESVLAALQAGAMGYLLKEAGRSEITQAIHTVAQGQSVFGAGVTGRVLAMLAAAAGSTTDNDPFPFLSERERSVLELMAAGFDNASIARKLIVSEKTVRNNVSLVFTKLQVQNRTEAIEKAKAAKPI